MNSIFLKDLSFVPDNIDPFTWNEYAYDKTLENGQYFDFNDSHYPWEFPYISELGKKLRVSYGELDWDSDSLLEKTLIPLWSKDIVKNNNDKDLIDTAEKLLSLKEDFDKKIEKLTREFFNIPVINSDVEGSIDKLLKINIHPDAIKNTDERRDLSKKFEDEYSDLSKIFLRKIVNAAIPYEAGESVLRKWVSIWESKALMGKNKSSMSIGLSNRFGLESRAEEVTADDLAIDRVLNGTGSYLYHIVAFPTVNLPYYFYDELVFMGGIQTIVRHDERMNERPFIESFNKTEDKKAWFNSVLDSGINYSFWWT